MRGYLMQKCLMPSQAITFYDLTELGGVALYLREDQYCIVIQYCKTFSSLDITLSILHNHIKLKGEKKSDISLN